MGSPQFVNAIRENGSIAHLRCLVESLVERLRWRSNQTDLLFSSTAPAPASSISRSPPRDDGHTLLPPKDDKIVSSTADSIASATGSESLLKANDAVRTTNSRQSADVSPAHDGGDGEEHGLSLSGNILARAILCPEGISVALARAARKKNRSRATRTGDTAGGNGGSGDGFDTETWRREISAVRGGEAGTLTVGDGAAAAERVLKEIKAWEKDRGEWGKGDKAGSDMRCECEGVIVGRSGCFRTSCVDGVRGETSVREGLRLCFPPAVFRVRHLQERR